MLRLLAVLLVSVALVASPAFGQAPPALRPLLPGAVATPPSVVAPPSAAPALARVEAPEVESPRRALLRFLNAAHAGRYADAARDLELTAAQAGAGPMLARRLQAVLDQRLPLDLERVSDQPGGELRDGLPPDQEELGRVPGPANLGPSARDPVRLRRLSGTGDDQARWVFSAATVRRIDSWYERLPDRWLRDHLPDVLLRVGPRGLSYWQWLALPVLLLATYLFAAALVFLGTRILLPLTRRTSAPWDELLLAELRTPGRLVVTSFLGELWTPLLYLGPAAGRTVQGVLSVVFSLGLLLGALRTIKVLVESIGDSPYLRARPAARGVLPLLRRLLEISLLAIAAVTALQSFGLEVTSLLAGLGIGGLAVALAAQKTVEHLFGGVMLSVDQPMRVGDLVKIGDILGTVEEIGLRSTRIRTLERTVVAIPNGKLAELNIETYGARDRIRLYQVLPVALETPPEKLTELIDAIVALLQAHPRLFPEKPAARILAFGDTGVQLEISCWFQTQDVTEFQGIRHEVLLGVLTVLAEHGVRPGYPGRSLRVAP